LRIKILLVLLLLLFSFPQKKRFIPYVNYGGCGYYAKYFYLKNPKVCIVNFYSDKKTKIHYMCYDSLTGYYYDYSGKRKNPVWKQFYNSRIVSYKFLDSALHTKGWNRKFNLKDTNELKKLNFEL